MVLIQLEHVTLRIVILQLTFQFLFVQHAISLLALLSHAKAWTCCQSEVRFRKMRFGCAL